MTLIGWYLGRYEGGMRHGKGVDIIMLNSEDEDLDDSYKIVPRCYNKGAPISHLNSLDNIKIVDNILLELNFFGFMGRIENYDDTVPVNDLNQGLRLTEPDLEFPESTKSIFNSNE